MFIAYCSLDDLSIVAPRRGMKEAGPKNFVMSLVAEIPNLCCEQARPTVSARGTEPRGRRFPILSAKDESSIVKPVAQVCHFLGGPAGARKRPPLDTRAPEIRFAEMHPPPSQKRRINYKLGSLYAVVTALLLSVQEPFSFLAAKRLSVTQFVFLTQVALVMSIPLLIVCEKSRRDLVLLLGNAANYHKFVALFLIGMIGLLLFKLGLSNAHPIIISAIINLQPFFAALVALLIARVPIPVSPAIFFGCLVSAFLGAMAIAWSQAGEANRPELSQLAESAPFRCRSARHWEERSSANGSRNTTSPLPSRRISSSQLSSSSPLPGLSCIGAPT
jgi:hypothetical protein